MYVQYTENYCKTIYVKIKARIYVYIKKNYPILIISSFSKMAFENPACN